jgi:hypothetical protein
VDTEVVLFATRKKKQWIVAIVFYVLRVMSMAFSTHGALIYVSDKVGELCISFVPHKSRTTLLKFVVQCGGNIRYYLYTTGFSIDRNQRDI